MAAAKDREVGPARDQASAPFADARILVVDDQAVNTLLLESRLRSWGYPNVVATNDSSKALSLLEAVDPDLVLLDLQMPDPDGFALLEAIQPQTRRPVPLPVIVVTSDMSLEARRRALACGASDFLTKPFDPDEVRLRTGNLLKTRMLQLELHDQNRALEQRVRERTSELDQARLDALDRLAMAAEYRDDNTHEHALRVGRTAALVAGRLGLDESEVDLLRRAAPLHDIGKLAISDSILLKHGKLSPAEFEVVKTHTTVGAQILSDGHSKLFDVGCLIALSHHEHWDGTGYPNGLAGDEIPLAGRIVKLADVFDALIHRRPYKKAWPIDVACKEIRSMAGQQLDPEVVAAFESLDQDPLVSPLFRPRVFARRPLAGYRPGSRSATG